MTVTDTVNRVFRNFKRYTGDGLPGEPTGAGLPVGDPQSGVYSPTKAELRAVLLDVIEAADDAAAVSAAAAAVSAAAAEQALEDALAIIVPDDAVTEPKLADAAVTEPKIADGAVSTAKVADNAITAAKLSAVNTGASRAKLDISSRFVGFYNASDGAAEYDHGVTISANPLSFGAGKIVNAVADDQSPTLAKDNKIKGAPCPVRVGDQIYVYYDGYGDQVSPMVGNIFVEIYDLDGNPRRRAVTPVIAPSDVSGAASLARPSVIYEPSDVTAPFKMAFSRATVAGGLNTSIWLATSLDGYVWTILGQAIATATGWEANSVISTGRLVIQGGLYHIFYGGYDGTSWKGGVATKAAFTSTGWTKNPNNPLLSPRGAYNVAPTVDIAAGARQVKVANSALWDDDAPMMLWTPSGPTAVEMNEVLDKPDGTTVRVKYPWLGSYTVVAGNKLSQIHSRSVDFSEVWFDQTDVKWKTIFTVFSFCPDANRETTAYAETTDLDDGFTIIPAAWPLPLQPRRAAFDRYSAENLKFVEVS